MRVCRSWWKFFDNVLLSHVEIKDNQARFTAFMDMLERFPHRKLQIEIPELNGCIPPRYNKRKLHIFLPFVYWGVLNDKDTHSKRDLQRKPLKTVPSKCRIEFLSDSFYCELARQMLVSKVYDQLDTLQSDFLGLAWVTGIFRELKHAPILRQLCLRTASIDLEELEIIHENTPSLKAFQLEWVKIVCDNDYPDNITPATSLTTLHISAHYASDINMHFELYRYMSQKYINAKDVRHKDAKVYDYPDQILKRFYFNSYLDFFKTIAHNQKSVHVNEYDSDMIDDYTAEYMRFTRKRLWDMLNNGVLQQEQHNATRKLTFFERNHSASQVLRYMPGLNTFKLDFTTHNFPFSIDLTPYSNTCPESVKPFDISCFQVEIDWQEMRPCYIESLNVNYSNINQDVLSLVDETLPKLRRFKITGSLREHRVALVFEHGSPLEEAVFDLKGSRPQGFRLKDPRSCNFYLFDGENITLAT